MALTTPLSRPLRVLDPDPPRSRLRGCSVHGFSRQSSCASAYAWGMQVRPAKPTAGVYDEEAADKESPRESLESMLPRTESDVPGVLDMMEFDLDEKDDIHRMFRYARATAALPDCAGPAFLLQPGT